nr:immunoglobulin heavy chain junction region [Macaca mulatta]
CARLAYYYSGTLIDSW